MLGARCCAGDVLQWLVMVSATNGRLLRPIHDRNHRPELTVNALACAAIKVCVGAFEEGGVPWTIASAQAHFWHQTTHKHAGINLLKGVTAAAFDCTDYRCDSCGA
jgi:hypothetical protein